MKHFALAGNPNCGKTTLFNNLTGSTAYVGNWPGVTVDKREGVYKKFQSLISLVFILYRLILLKKLFPETIFWMKNQIVSLILLMLLI